jgi:P4 family phage/plasmid primase-like protien
MKLSESDLRMLAASWITPDLAEAAGIFRVNSADGAVLVGRNGKGDYAGIVIPHTCPGIENTRENQLRLDHPELELKPDGSTNEKNKYLFPPGRSNILYFPPGVTPEMLTNVNLPIIICEGAKKALAIWRLATEGRDCPRFLPIAVSGVWNWHGTVGKESGLNGSRQSVKGPISDLARIKWKGRTAYVLYDGDKASNMSVLAAERGLARELKSRGSIVKIIDLPSAPRLSKPDDYLANPEGGPTRMLTLIDDAREFEPNLLRYLQNDHGNAERLIAVYGDVLRFCHPMKKWLVWDGRRWVIDVNKRAHKFAKLTMLEYLQQSVKAESEKHGKFAQKSLDTKCINALLESAQSEIYVELDQLDTHPYLLNCTNGIVDLRTGMLLPHDPTLYITKLVHFDFNPDAICPTWKSFLYRIMGLEENSDRAERLVRWLQKAFGYSITSITSEKAVFVCWGPTDAGKSTMLSNFRSIVDEYSGLLQIDTLMIRREETNASLADLADLRGCRFIQTSETEKGQRLAEGKLKRISQGTGKIKACRKYENPIQFVETHKLWIDANHKPRVKGNDGATWNRLYPIPFTVQIPKKEQDRHLAEKLLAEAEGVLAWTIAGAIRWYAEGLGKPEEIEAANREWKADEDTQGKFIAECIEPGESDTEAARVYSVYRWWCEKNGEKPDTATAFGRGMTDQDYSRGSDPKTRRTTYKCIKIITNIEAEFASDLHKKTGPRGLF